MKKFLLDSLLVGLVPRNHPLKDQYNQNEKAAPETDGGLFGMFGGSPRGNELP